MSGNAEFIERPERREYPQTGTLCGILDVTVECVTDLHIGCGENRLENGTMPKRFMTMNGKPVIPGSSMKGAIRSLASSVSHACSANDRFNACKPPKKGQPASRCIICSMFGMMGYASRVDFTEFTTESGTVCKKLPKPFPPPKENGRYINQGGNLIKLYRPDAVCERERINVDVVPEGTVFKGKIFYKNITEEQLSLLLFSLGADGTFLPALGGFKYCRLGRARITAQSGQCEVKALADKYAQYADKSGCSEQINRLREILGKGAAK